MPARLNREEATWRAKNRSVPAIRGGERLQRTLRWILFFTAIHALRD
jgi:hypothetical protein